MKNKSILLAFAIGIATLSVTASQHPPPVDKDAVSTIDQTATAQMPIEFTITPYSHDVAVMSVSLLGPDFETTAKPSPVAQSVCTTYAPISGVDGKAVLSWCIKDYNYLIPALNFNYQEGRATEYRWS